MSNIKYGCGTPVGGHVAGLRPEDCKWCLLAHVTALESRLAEKDRIAAGLVEALKSLNKEVEDFSDRTDTLWPFMEKTREITKKALAAHEAKEEVCVNPSHSHADGRCRKCGKKSGARRKQ